MPDKALRGKAAETNELVEACKASKGKMFCDEVKKCPPEIKSATGKATANEEDQGFMGQKIGDVKTGKAKQYHTDGSFFDCFMLNDEFVRGRIFFANGDHF